MQQWFNHILDATKQHVKDTKAKYPFTARPLAKKHANLCFKFLQKAWQDGRYSLIAEIKKNDPFLNHSLSDFSAQAIAKAYDKGGATCLAISTISDFFQGDIDHIIQARKITKLPIVQKDLTIDPFQIDLAAHLGANAVILPIRALDDQTLQDFEKHATALGIDVLALVFDVKDLERCLHLLYTPLILCNNRHLVSGKIETDTTIELAKNIPKDRLLISDVGITSPQIMSFLGKRGASSFVIGSTLLKEEDIITATQEFLVNCAEFSDNIQTNIFRI